MAEPAKGWEQSYLEHLGEDISDLRSRFGKLEDRGHGIETNMVTKEDLRRVEARMDNLVTKEDWSGTKEDIRELRAEMKGMATKEEVHQLRSAMDGLRNYLTCGFLGVIAISVISSLLHWFHP